MCTMKRAGSVPLVDVADKKHRPQPFALSLEHLEVFHRHGVFLGSFQTGGAAKDEKSYIAPHKLR